MARCLDCEHMHHPDKGRDLYFCLKTRDYIEHDVKQLINCSEFMEIGSERQTYNRHKQS